MKAISLWQPWASLWACGAKEFETRSWATSYRGPIAIHAAAKKPSSMWEVIENIIDRVRAALGIIDPDDLPRGAIIATAELVDCHRIFSNNGKIACFGGKDIAVSGDELLFGDWTPGRYAWEIANVRMLDKPIPAKGAQGLWNWRAT